MKTASMVLLVGVGAVACGGESQVRRGIYQLEAVKVSDSCTPARLSGDLGEASIELRPEGPAITIPVGEVWNTQAQSWAYWQPTVPETTGLTKEVKPPRCDTGVEHSSLEWLSDQEPLEIRYRQSWTGLAGCAPGTEFSEWPEADCSTETTLRYKLVEACPERCSLRSTWVLGQPNHYVCDCG
ncbi:hypothetical protein [Archangium sp.]|jgi:hypothetical protein|uniref:hypothetical protein n=1 Tax=Archangium sp. TaxID=1872627 RepID=UPI002ED939DB